MTTIPPTEMGRTVRATDIKKGQWSTMRRVLSTPSGVIGFIVTSIIVLVAIFGPLIAPFDPNVPDTTYMLKSSSSQHWFGTDEIGRDLFSRVIYGSSISLWVAGLSVFLAVLVGTALGLASTLGGRWWDFIIMRFMDGLLAFPVMILAIAISIGIGRGITGLVAAIAVVNIPVFTRLTRAQGMQIREREYVTASRALGGGVLRIAVKDMLPNLLNALIVQASVTVSFAIVTEASLSFLGLGIQQPTPSWGSMIATAKNYLSTAPHMMFFPAVALCLTVLGLNLFGDALCDALDPQQTGGQ